VDNSERILLTGDGRRVNVLKTVTRVTLSGRECLLDCFTDITELSMAREILMQNEARAQALLELSQAPVSSAREIAGMALEAAVRITGSSVGFVGTSHDDGKSLDVLAWSKGAMEACAPGDTMTCFAVGEAGLWGEALRRREAVITNDYAASCHEKKGLPEGHSALTRMLSVPIFEDNRVVMMIGLANREKAYTEADAVQASLLMNNVWRIMRQKTAEEERRKMELLLMEAKKMEAVGQLSAGVAHEINTPMQFVNDNTRFLQDSLGDIMGALEACERFCASSSPGAEEIAELKERLQAADLPYLKDEIPAAIAQTLEGIQRVIKIVQAMKEFARPDDEGLVFLDLNRAIESTITVASNEWKYVAEMITDLDPALPFVQCIPGAVNQVILNLVINAAQAIGEAQGGKDGGRGRITISTATRDAAVEIRINDTGAGIPEKHRSRIFDPFFTTKEVGKGTGQGLTMAYNVIVTQHRGTIFFETEEGAGTTFIIRLPLRQDAGEPLAVEG
jgi:signal transduction histidine kinase